MDEEKLFWKFKELEEQIETLKEEVRNLQREIELISGISSTARGPIS